MCKLIKKRSSGIPQNSHEITGRMQALPLQTAILILLMALFITGSLFALGTPGLHFTLIDDDTAYEVSRGTAFDTHIDIPATYDSRPVTAIAYQGFYNFTTMTSISIGSSVTSIGNQAFSYCSGLTSITFPNNLISIGDSAFSNCPSLTSIDIPNNVTSIGVSAFSSCIGLESVTIGNSVISIGANAFIGCTKLTSITIPNSVTSIGTSAFNGCTGLTSITIGNSVTTMGWYAFDGCTAVTSFYVDSNAAVGLFENSSTLKSVTIGNNVTSIVNDAFRNCPELTSVTFSEPSSVTHIGINMFAFCTSLSSITIPNNVISIDNNAFYQCTSLTSINIPNSVTSIGLEAFGDCTELTSVYIPNSVIDIGSSAFAGCTNLTIYTEAENLHAGWYANWNSSNRPVIWDYVNTAIPPTALSAVYEHEFIKLSWTEPLITAHWTLSYYQVYRDGNIIGANITELFFEDENFVDGEENEYYVVAVYSNPVVESVPSNSVVINLGGILPITLSEFGATSEDNGVKVHWTTETETNMTGYKIKRAEVDNVSAGVYISLLIYARNNPTTEHYYHIDTDVINGKEYFYWLEAIENNGSLEVFGPVSVVYTPDDKQPIPMTTMSSAYPNPMSIGTSASFDIAVKTNETAELRIYNIRGQVVRSYENLPAGHQTVIWDAKDTRGREVSSGVYFYRLTSPSSHIVQRMVVIK